MAAAGTEPTAESGAGSEVETCAGYLLKRGEKGLVKGWKKRWFSLRGGRLYYFKVPESPEPISYISLAKLASLTPGSKCPPPKKKQKDCVFELTCDQRAYVLATETADEKARWLRALEAARACLDDARLRLVSRMDESQRFALAALADEAEDDFVAEDACEPDGGAQELALDQRDSEPGTRELAAGSAEDPNARAHFPGASTGHATGRARSESLSLDVASRKADTDSLRLSDAAMRRADESACESAESVLLPRAAAAPAAHSVRVVLCADALPAEAPAKSVDAARPGRRSTISDRVKAFEGLAAGAVAATLPQRTGAVLAESKRPVPAGTDCTVALTARVTVAELLTALLLPKGSTVRRVDVHVDSRVIEDVSGELIPAADPSGARQDRALHVQEDDVAAFAARAVVVVYLARSDASAPTALGAEWAEPAVPAAPAAAPQAAAPAVDAAASAAGSTALASLASVPATLPIAVRSGPLSDSSDARQKESAGRAHHIESIDDEIPALHATAEPANPRESPESAEQPETVESVDDPQATPGGRLRTRSRSTVKPSARAAATTTNGPTLALPTRMRAGGGTGRPKSSARVSLFSPKFTLHEPAAVPEPSGKVGFLLKRGEGIGGRRKQRRLFRLIRDKLSYYDGEVRKGVIALASATRIAGARDPLCLVIEAADRKYTLYAETPEDKISWLTALQAAREFYRTGSADASAAAAARSLIDEIDFGDGAGDEAGDEASADSDGGSRSGSDSTAAASAAAPGVSQAPDGKMGVAGMSGLLAALGGSAANAATSSEPSDGPGEAAAPSTAAPRGAVAGPVSKCGFLLKRGVVPALLQRGAFGFKRRWFVLAHGMLAYGETEGGAVKDSFALTEIVAVAEAESAIQRRYKWCAFTLSRGERTYELVAESPNEMRAWLEALVQGKRELESALAARTVDPNAAASQPEMSLLGSSLAASLSAAASLLAMTGLVGTGHASSKPANSVGALAAGLPAVAATKAASHEDDDEQAEKNNKNSSNSDDDDGDRGTTTFTSRPAREPPVGLYGRAPVAFGLGRASPPAPRPRLIDAPRSTAVQAQADALVALFPASLRSGAHGQVDPRLSVQPDEPEPSEPNTEYTTVSSRAIAFWRAVSAAPTSSLVGSTPARAPARARSESFVCGANWPPTLVVASVQLLRVVACITGPSCQHTHDNQLACDFNDNDDDHNDATDSAEDDARADGRRRERALLGDPVGDDDSGGERPTRQRVRSCYEPLVAERVRDIELECLGDEPIRLTWQPAALRWAMTRVGSRAAARGEAPMDVTRVAFAGGLFVEWADDAGAVWRVLAGSGENSLESESDDAERRAGEVGSDATEEARAHALVGNESSELAEVLAARSNALWVEWLASEQARARERSVSGSFSLGRNSPAGDVPRPMPRTRDSPTSDVTASVASGAVTADVAPIESLVLASSAASPAAASPAASSSRLPPPSPSSSPRSPSKLLSRLLGRSASAAPEPERDVNALVAQLELACADCVAHFNPDTPDDWLALGSDRENATVALLVRGRLCDAISALQRDGFTRQRRAHFVDFIMAAVETPALARIEMDRAPVALGLQAAVNALAHSGQGSNPSMMFRSLVCAGLNCGSLSDWLRVAFLNGQTLRAFYAPSAALADSEVLERVCVAMDELALLPFDLSLDLECASAALRATRDGGLDLVGSS